MSNKNSQKGNNYMEEVKRIHNITVNNTSPLIYWPLHVISARDL